MAIVKQLFTHPVKGLTPQAWERVMLQVGHGIPGDRAFALMYAEKELTNAVDLQDMGWLKKQFLAMQNDWPGLAALGCQYDAQTQTLIVQRQGVTLLSASTATSEGRTAIGTFFTGYLAALHPTQTARHPHKAPLQFIGNVEGNTRYPDREPVHISLIGQASLAHLGEQVGHDIDPRRFRPNILLDGTMAWEEFAWVNQEFALGTARIAITAPINRCLNIDVHPDTGERDIALLSRLQPLYGHCQVGVLARVIESGEVAIGDSLQAL